MKIWKFFIILCLLHSCSDENVLNNNPEDSEDTEEQVISDAQFAANNFGNSVSHDFVGLVVDQSGERLQNVEISIGNEITFTDQYGVFILNGVSVFEKFALVKAKKEGYLLGSRAIIPTSGNNDIKIVLLDKEISASVMSGETSTVLEQSSGVKVEFTGAFVDQSGHDYSGQVDISIHYLEPNISSTFIEMPGMLFGKRTDGSPTALETFGMVAVNLFSPNGELLNINPDTIAKITIPIISSAPNTSLETPIWFFDETTGYWKEQGVSNIIDNNYIAEVSHFSWWNIDAPIDYIEACFELKEENVLPNFYFEIVRDFSGQVIFSGYSNDLGLECGLFPKDENLTIHVYGPQVCSNEIIHTTTLGPFSNDINLVIDIPDLPTNLIQTTISATINDCNGNPLTNGYGLFFNTNATDFADYEVFPISNGFLSYDTVYCNNGNYNLIIFDQNTEEGIELEHINLEPATTNLETISICGTVENIFIGDVTLLSQQDVDDFGVLGYTKIEGELKIGGDNDSDISDLSSLQNLIEVTHFIRLNKNPNLSTLNGLNNISIAQGVWLMQNNALLSLEGLADIEYLEYLAIYNNSSLISLTGLSNIETVDFLYVSGNSTLNSLDGLQNISDVFHMEIIDNQSLESVDGLPAFLNNGDLWIYDNPNLLSLQGSEHLNQLSNLEMSNNGLTSLEGINNLTSINSLYISRIEHDGNEFLVDFCALQNLFTSGTYETVVITNNAFNPTIQDIIDGNCAQ